MSLQRFIGFTAFIALFTVSEPAYAYMGLGPLVPIIGNGILLLFVAGVTLFGLVAYPLKMLYAKMTMKGQAVESSTKDQ